MILQFQKPVAFTPDVAFASLGHSALLSSATSAISAFQSAVFRMTNNRKQNDEEFCRSRNAVPPCLHVRGANRQRQNARIMSPKIEFRRGAQYPNACRPTSYQPPIAEAQNKTSKTSCPRAIVQLSWRPTEQYPSAILAPRCSRNALSPAPNPWPPTPSTHSLLLARPAAGRHTERAGRRHKICPLYRPCRFVRPIRLTYNSVTGRNI